MNGEPQALFGLSRLPPFPVLRLTLDSTPKLYLVDLGPTCLQSLHPVEEKVTPLFGTSHSPSYGPEDLL